MTLSMLGLLVLAAVDLLLLIWLIVSPELAGGRVGGLVTAIAFLLLPAAVLTIGTGQHLERATTTSFCLSCHVMSDYGRSLHVDDGQLLAATHFQNRLVPRDKACYACHTDYTMFGDLAAKMRGVRHLYVQYLGTPPERLTLYGPYQNRECLHCHEGARRFSEGAFHADDLERLESSEISCLSSGCHDTTHAVESIDELKLWRSQTR